MSTGEGAEEDRIAASALVRAEARRRVRRRRRVLFLAYYFPPVNKVGALRAFNIAKYLTLLGWEVTVVTPEASAWRTVDSPEKVERELEIRGIRCIRTAHRWRLLSPFDLISRDQGLGWAVGGVCRKIARNLGIGREAGWIPKAKEACFGLAPEDVDLILATGPPFSQFRLAKELSGRLGVPYVLDYRDLWTDNPYLPRRLPRSRILEEKALLSGSAATTAVSPGLRESLARRFGVASKVYVVTNGYDPQDLSSLSPAEFGHFAIVYAGTFHPPKSVIDPVMAALRRLKDGGPPAEANWMFHYYGPQEKHVQNAANRFGISDKVVLHGHVSRTDAIRAVKGAGVAIVITSIGDETSLEDRGIITGKVFETIGVGTPVLALAPAGGDLEALFERVGLGRCFPGADTDAMAEFLRKIMLGAAPPAREPESFSWVNVVQSLDRVLQGVLSESHAPLAVPNAVESEGARKPGSLIP